MEVRNKQTKIIIRDGIIRQGSLEFRVKKLILDHKGRILRVEGKELCTICKDYLINQPSGKYCPTCNYDEVLK